MVAKPSFVVELSKVMNGTSEKLSSMNFFGDIKEHYHLLTRVYKYNRSFLASGKMNKVYWIKVSSMDADYLRITLIPHD